MYASLGSGESGFSSVYTSLLGVATPLHSDSFTRVEEGVQSQFSLPKCMALYNGPRRNGFIEKT